MTIYKMFTIIHVIYNFIVSRKLLSQPTTVPFFKSTILKFQNYIHLYVHIVLCKSHFNILIFITSFIFYNKQIIDNNL